MSMAEKFIEDYTRNCSNYTGVIEKKTCNGIYAPWLTPDQVLRAVEIAREEIYEWLQVNAYKYSIVGFYTEAMITDLKQAMKDEK